MASPLGGQSSHFGTCHSPGSSGSLEVVNDNERHRFRVFPEREIEAFAM